MLKGYLEEVTGRRARGWATAGNGKSPELGIFVNGIATAQFKPSLERPDLAKFSGCNPGFDVDLGQTLERGDIVSITDNRGGHLTGSPCKVIRIEATREEKALWLISRSMKILEIGPSFNPITPRSQGWNSFSLDHATQEELQAKYRGQQQPIERIEPVDYLWKGGPIETAIPKPDHGSFDVVVASHVIEHFPDPLGFLLSCAVLLKEDGLISLLIPDKRTMFDFFKPVTLTSDYLYAHYLGRTRHPRKTVFDSVAYNVHERGDIAWSSSRPVGAFGFFGENTLLEAKLAFDQTADDENAPYVDFHGTVYTPSSFALIILELSQLGILPFSVARTFPTNGCEFYLTLRNAAPTMLTAAKLQEERLRLMKAVVRELGEQAQWLTGDESKDASV